MSKIVTNPTAKHIKDACKKFDHKYPNVDDLLRRVFEQCPRNTESKDVLLKVATLNALYSTRMLMSGKKHTTLLDAANHIKKHGSRIDRMLGNSSDKVVGLIADTKVKRTKTYRYSFATKYCSWHKPESYPIFDAQVEAYLWHLMRERCLEKRRKKDLRNYAIFKEIVYEFRAKIGLPRTSLKNIDKFMFYEGKKLLPIRKKKAKPAPASSRSPKSGG